MTSYVTLVSHITFSPSPVPLDEQAPVAGPSNQRIQDVPHPDVTLASSELQDEVVAPSTSEPTPRPPLPLELIRENAGDNLRGLNREVRRQEYVRTRPTTRSTTRARSMFFFYHDLGCEGTTNMS